jgi:hypothetical protein
MIRFIGAVVLLTTVSGCAEYQGRKTNCWSPASGAQPVLTFSASGCEFISLPSPEHIRVISE